MTGDLTQKNKQLVWDFWETLNSTEASQFEQIARDYVLPDVTWIGAHPFNQLSGLTEVQDKYWQPLAQSFSGLKRVTYIFFGGKSNGRIDGTIELDGQEWVCGLGHFEGTFKQDWLSIPASGETIKIRWSEFCRVEDGKIAEIHILLDIPDVMRQAGYPVFPPDRGAAGVWLPPQAGDGLLLDTQDDEETTQSMRLIRAMIYEGLNNYDQSELQSMGMAQFFRDDLQWYGPAGIGTCRSLKEFEEFHQKHWLHAFPNRQVQDLDSLFAEGRYMGASGWAGVIATHQGEYLDAPASGNTISVRGIDIWNREDNKLVENWVFVDMIDLFLQMDIDLFERLQQLVAQNNT